MKKLFSLILCVLFLSLNSNSGVYAKTLTPEKRIATFLNSLESNEEFTIWKNKDISKKVSIYGSTGDLSAYLFNITNKNDIIGYVLLRPSDNQILEYPLGESPYNRYLESYISTKFKNTNKKQKTLIYDGPSMYGVKMEESFMYGVKIEDTSQKEETFYFTNDASVDLNIDTSSGVKKFKSQQADLNINSTLPANPLNSTRSSNINTKILNVYGYNVYSEGCGANAGSMIVKYWDNNGYPNLINGTTSQDTVKSELKDLMGTFSVIIGDATLIDGYINGLQSYFTTRGYGFASVLMTKNYVTLKSQINANNPGTILYWGHKTADKVYGYHYVVFNGYTENYDTNESYYIIKDGWSGNENTYRNWDIDSPYIGSMVKTYKN